MNKTNLSIPDSIGYLSEWTDFDFYLPKGKIIVNKVICGCGMTHYYLTNPTPVILISPRKNLILSKVKDPNLPNIHYFDRSNPKDKIQDTKIYLKQYLSNPFQQTGFVPKILVTYDSFPIVEELLRNMGMLHNFTLVVDEFSCLFTDARMKGLTDMKLLTRVLSLPNRAVFISATPIKETYLDQMPEFQNMTYVTLEWDSSRVRAVSITNKGMDSTRKAISDIITDFRHNGFFQEKEIAGKRFYSLEGVFFLNSVKDIVAIVKNNGLTSKDTRVVCADTDENRKILKRYGLSVETFPSRQHYQDENKTFTFVTRACFEGADLYSDTATTFVFADSNRENLSLDISIDLSQIIGRCRTMTNPFINDIFYYYRTTDRTRFDYDKQCAIIDQREKTTNDYLFVNNSPINPVALRKLINAQKYEKYENDYIDVVVDNNGNGTMIFNRLVYLSDIRAIEIKNNQYKDPQTLLLYLSGNGFSLNSNTNISSDPYDIFRHTFEYETNFELRLRMLFNAMQKDPNISKCIKQDSSFPLDFKKIAFNLGDIRCSGLGYNERKIRQTIAIEDNKATITSHLTRIIEPDKTYTKNEIKRILQDLYDNLGMTITAKAIHINTYLQGVSEVNYTDVNGKRLKGYKIKLSAHD